MTLEPTLDGVRFLDHTADVGLLVRARSREGMFLAAAAGLRALLDGDGGETRPRPAAPGAPRGEAGPGREDRDLVLESEDAAGLLRSWLRELLWLHEVEQFALRSASFRRLDDSRLEASLRLEAAPPHPLREIKGVTYHALSAARVGAEWRARVVFDV